MMLQGCQPGTALGWVRDDLDKRLEQLRMKLEHLASARAVNKEAILDTGNQVEDLRMTLNTLVLPGAALVAEEMHALLDRLGHHRVDNRQKAFDALMEAALVLPAYLDRLQAGHHDLPLLLLPVVNRLRGSHHAPQMQEGSLFAPVLDAVLPELEDGGQPPVSDESFTDFATRLRGQFEGALLNWQKEQESKDLLSPLQGVCETLMHRVQREDLRRTWWIASEAIGGLIDGAIRNNAHFRRLLARVHLNLRHLSEGGEEAVDPSSANALSQALLFSVAQVKVRHAGLDQIKKRFQLDGLIPRQDELLKARGAVTGKDRQMYLSLSEAVKDELSLIKDALDLEMRTGTIDEERRAQGIESLERLLDTLRMLGLSDTAQSIEVLLPALDGREPADGEEHQAFLMSLAQQLLAAESAVQEQIATLGEPLEDTSGNRLTELPAHEYRQILNHVLDETVASIHQYQEAIKSRLGGNRDADLLKPVDEVAAALDMIGDSTTARLSRRLQEDASALLKSAMSESAVPPRKLEWFTDAVAALELYLAACRDQQGNREWLVEILGDRLDRLERDEQEEPVARAGPTTQETVPDPAPGRGPEQAPGPGAADTTALPEADRIDPELLEVFLEEYEDVSEALQQHLPKWLAKLDEVKPLTEVRRGFHTLKGSGRMVGAFELGDFCWQIEEMLNALLDTRVKAFADAAVTVRLAQAALPALKQRLMNQPAGLGPEVIAAIGAHAERLTRNEPSDWHGLKEQLPGYLAGMLPQLQERAREGAGTSEDSDLKQVLHDEFYENLAHLQGLLESISRDRKTLASADQIRAAHTIAGALALEPGGRGVEVARALESLLQAQQVSGVAFSADAIWALGSSLECLQAQLSRLEGGSADFADEDEQALINQLSSLAASFEQADTAAAQPADQDPGDEEESLPDQEQVSLQDDIVHIYLEEAQDILGRCDSLLNTWRDNLADLALVRSLQREIHTFKGGARMAGLNALGDLSHAMESLLERIHGQGLSPSESSVQALETGCDRLHEWLEQVGQGTTPDAESALALFAQQVQDLTAVPLTAFAPDLARSDDQPRVVTDIPEDVGEDIQPAASLGDEAAGTGQVRVAADLLDTLINSAGEVNIFRSRLERQVSNLRGNLNEFRETTARLTEQFRKLEIETETQIRSRYRQTADDGNQDFDPLELDRFSSMQQHSRGLSESVADLLNLQELLDEAARQSEALLAQQSRVSTELQEGLMQTRMVPFGSIAPRLRRLVRTAAGETGKKARLKLLMAGSSDQLDRNVLQRITVPLEHMLRNSIAHGIENPKVRKKLGKKAEGEISVTVESEATEFVIRIEDDGAGIDLDAVRDKAVKMKLLPEEATPPPRQLLEFILHSGFSTSGKVTGLAGRGVGMDVVNNEIRHIGGSLEIDSEPGKWTRFTIRIPFTLAMMQVIGVMAGEHRYLIPLANVNGVARLLPSDYTALLENPAPAYEFAGRKYPVLDLEPLLGEPAAPLGNDNVSLLMIHAGDQMAALRVAQLLGHREIVIKPVGLQISSVPGILGGTVTGDGSVVVILDPGSLIRHAVIHGVRPVTPLRQSADIRQRRLAMVVDDSITMRKVNSRVLEGHDFEVTTARDGVDATEQMQDRIPDIILLDIEMPRMDGYELAEYVRADPRLRKIPIIMITSRSGEKHRERAEQAGANAYLTKPYKETELVSEVYRLLGMETH